MSQSQEPAAGARVTRIDPAHPIRSKEPLELAAVPRELALIAAGEVGSHAGEQIRTQASQLAGHLRAKQQQIDHREAQLNARIAQLEREVRTSRLWCAEREHLFIERERELEQEIFELQQEIKAFTASEVSAYAELDEHRAELREREADLAAREHRLCAGQMQVAEEAASLRVAIERLTSERAEHERQATASAQQLELRETQFAEQQQRLLANLARHRDALDQQREELGGRSRQEVADVLALLDEQTTTLQDERLDFEAQRDTAKEELLHEREQFEERKRATEQDLARLRDKLNVRQASVDQRRASLEQMKQQVFELHRETIEMRMVAEQLWQHAAKGKPVAELTQSLGTLRAKLVDGFRVSHDELTQKEQHLRELAGKLNGRQQQLKQQRDQLNQWLERQNAGIEEQAARLVARELELDAQQQAIRERELAWRAERLELQTRLRQFTKQFRSHSQAAA